MLAYMKLLQLCPKAEIGYFNTKDRSLTYRCLARASYGLSAIGDSEVCVIRIDRIEACVLKGEFEGFKARLLKVLANSCSDDSAIKRLRTSEVRDAKGSFLYICFPNWVS